MPISQIVTNSIANTAVTAAKLASDAFSAQIFKPSITAPANNATGILDTQLFTATTYLSLYGRSQANANWQISTSPTFAFINVNSTITGSNTQFQANASSGLVANTTVHYARVRYSDDANNSSDYSNTVQFTTAAAFTFSAELLALAGGGGGGGNIDGGGGAGGLLYYGSEPGNNGSALTLSKGTSYTVTIGGGGAGFAGFNGQGAVGSNTVFDVYTARGGGRGGGNDISLLGGGSGGGIGHGLTSPVGGSAISGQGSNGGGGVYNAPNYPSGGGGGKGAVGGTPPSSGSGGGSGGDGLAHSITGAPVTRAGGGGAGTFPNGSPYGSGGTGGGGAGGGTNGTTNFGGGGGCNGGNGGSGIVIVKYPDNITISNPGGGLTFNTTTSAPNKVTQVTAGTGSVQFN